MARIYKSGLYDRIVFFESWKEKLEDEGTKVPVGLKIHIKAMKKEYDEIKDL